MSDHKGWIVRSTAGREKGRLFCVVGTQGERLLLCDGKGRKITSPKQKKLGHVEVLAGSGALYGHPVIQALQQGKPVTNNDIRRALAAFRAKEV